MSKRRKTSPPASPEPNLYETIHPRGGGSDDQNNIHHTPSSNETQETKRPKTTNQPDQSPNQHSANSSKPVPSTGGGYQTPPPNEWPKVGHSPNQGYSSMSNNTGPTPSTINTETTSSEKEYKGGRQLIFPSALEEIPPWAQCLMKGAYFDAHFQLLETRFEEMKTQISDFISTMKELRRSAFGDHH